MHCRALLLPYHSSLCTQPPPQHVPHSVQSMLQRLTARDLYREMAHLPPEYPPGVLLGTASALGRGETKLPPGSTCSPPLVAISVPHRGSCTQTRLLTPLLHPAEAEADSPDHHLRVADLASEEEEMLPDDPLDLDEELITGVAWV